MDASDVVGQAQAQVGTGVEVGERRAMADGKQMEEQTPTHTHTDDVDMENLFSNDDANDDDDDMESLFGSLDDDTEETSLASPTPTAFSAATPVSLPLPLPMPMPKSACLPLPTSSTYSTPPFPLPLPALPSSSAAAVPADRNTYCDVSTSLPESNREDGQRAEGGDEHQTTQTTQPHTDTLPDPSPSGFDLNTIGLDLNLGLDIGDMEFDFNLDLGNFNGNDTSGGFAIATAPLTVDAGAEIDFDFRLDADEERQLAREMGLELDDNADAGEGENKEAEADTSKSSGADIDTGFDFTGLGSTATHHDDQEGQGRRMHDGQQHDLSLDLGTGLDFDFGLFSQTQTVLADQAAPGVPETTGTPFSANNALGGSASTPMVIDSDAAPTSESASASDDVVVLYERPACARFVPMSASEHAETPQSVQAAKPAPTPAQPPPQPQPQPKTAVQPALQLLSPASEPLSQPSSRHASEEASPVPTTLFVLTSAATTSAPSHLQPQSHPQNTQTQLQPVPSFPKPIPHYLELRPRCPQTPPPKRIDLGEFKIEELLPYVQLHSKLSMSGIQQMLGLDSDAGRIVVGECRRYLADPTHRVAPSGTSDPAALRTLKVALIQSALRLLKYGETHAQSQNLENGVGERWFSRRSQLEPRSMHLWPDDSTTLVLLFIQLLYRLTRNNSVRERQRKASALRKAEKLQQQQQQQQQEQSNLQSPSQSQSQSQSTPPHSPSADVTTEKEKGKEKKKEKTAPRAKKRARFPSHEAAVAAKHPRLSPPAFPLLNAEVSLGSSAPRAAPSQIHLAYNSPRVLRDDLIQSASAASTSAPAPTPPAPICKAPATASIRYIVNVVDRSAQRVVPQLELGHDGPIRSAGYSHLAQRVFSFCPSSGVPSISIMTPLGLERVGSDADWDRVVCRVHDDMIMDRQVRVLITLG